MKRLFLLGVLIALAGCVPDTGVTVEYSRGVTDIGCVEQVELDGFMYLPNALHDTLIDKTMKGLATGAFDLSKFSYVQMYHIENDGANQDTSWENLVMSLHSGGGDTASSCVMRANYTATVGIAWDTASRQKCIGEYTGDDSNPHWYAVQNETTGMGSGDGVQYDWEWTASKTGTAILDTLLFHIVDLWVTGGCDEIDTAVLIYNNGDTVRIVPTYSIDYPNDTLTWTTVDTTRSVANDSLLYGLMLDDDGVVIYHKSLGVAVANPSAVRWKVKLHFTEI